MVSADQDSNFDEFDNLVDDDTAFQDEAFAIEEEPRKKKSSAAFYLILLIIVALAGGAAWFLFLRPVADTATVETAQTAPAEDVVASITELPPGVTAPEATDENLTDTGLAPEASAELPVATETPAEVSPVTGLSAEALPPPIADNTEETAIDPAVAALEAAKNKAQSEETQSETKAIDIADEADDALAPNGSIQEITSAEPVEAMPQAVAETTEPPVEAIPAPTPVAEEVPAPAVAAPVDTAVVAPAVDPAVDQRITQLEDQLRSVSADVAVAKAAVNNTSSQAASAASVDTSGLEKQLQDLAEKLDRVTQQVESLDQRTTTFATELQNQANRAPSETTSTPKVQAVSKPKPAPAKRAPAYKPPVKAAPKAASAGGWELRSAQPGVAWLGRNGSSEMTRYAVGQNVPNLGTVKAVRQEGGRWIVETSGGTLRQ